MAYRRCDACDGLIAMRAQACPHCDVSFVAEPEPDQATMTGQGGAVQGGALQGQGHGQSQGGGLAFVAYCLVGFAIFYAVMDFTS